MKKRNVWAVVCFISCLLCMSTFTNLVVSATEITVTPDMSGDETFEIETDAVSSENAEASDDEGGNFDLYAFYMRLWEFAEENRSDLVGLVCSAVVAALTLIAKRSNDKKSNAISQDLKAVKQDASGTHASQGSVIGAVNTMIDGYNEMRESYEKYEGVEDDRNKLIGAVFIQNTAILEILTTVYANSKNMPQGVKDLVNLKYARCLKALESDESLRGVVETVRKEIGSTDAVIEEAEASEATEGVVEDAEE